MNSIKLGKQTFHIGKVYKLKFYVHCTPRIVFGTIKKIDENHIIFWYPEGENGYRGWNGDGFTDHWDFERFLDRFQKAHE